METRTPLAPLTTQSMHLTLIAWGYSVDLAGSVGLD